MSWLDGIIEKVAPTWAVNRKAARLALEQAEKLGAFRGGASSRLDKDVKTRGTSADWDNEYAYDRRKQVDRARQLERDNVLAEALLSRSTEAVLGTGYTLQAKATDDIAPGSDEFNELAESMWVDWCRNGADSRGIHTFWELGSLGFRGMLRDGDHGFALLREGSLRAYESDEISDPLGGYSRANMVDGVELDNAGKPVAFHVDDPNLANAPVGGDRRGMPNRARIPADDFIFLARRTRAGQTRGITAFNGSFWLTEQIDGLVEGVTVAARMAACFGLIIKKAGPLTGLGAQTAGADGGARKNLSLEPGSFMTLDRGDEVVQVNPSHPSQPLEAHIRMLVRLVGIPFGVPLGITLLDFSQANYSSSRAELLQAWSRWRVHQAQIACFASEIYQWKILNWIREGKLPARLDAFSHSWVKPGWQWLDPVAEIKAAIAAVDANLDTKASIVARMGVDWDDLIEQRGRELEDEAENGVPSVRSMLTRDPMPQNGATDPNQPARAPSPDQVDDQN